MITNRQFTAQQLKDAYAAGERDFREIKVLREGLDRGADLSGANLRGANLEGANLEGADLSGADLSGADLRRANLRRADLYGANLRRANLEGADLRRANLRRANLEGADLSGADLSGADLYGADLYGADLSGADLYGADLYGANLRGAGLEGAGLEGAKHFLSARIPYMSSRGVGTLFTGTMYRDRLVVYAGCFESTPPEFRAQVAETHGDNIHAQLYLAQLAVFEAAWRHWLTALEPGTVTETAVPK